MIWFSWYELLWMVLIAILIDAWIGDPRWLSHPVIWIGKWIRIHENWLLTSSVYSPYSQRFRGIALVIIVTSTTSLTLLAVILLAYQLHPWLAYLLNTWFIATTIACKGLKDAANEVLQPLELADVAQARVAVSMIVGRDTERLDEPEIVRATVETVAENTVDAFVSPLVYALLGGAPLAMLYRSVNTLDSMVGYKNERYFYFGWASARFDDWLNYVPARMTGLILMVAAWLLYGFEAARRTVRSIRQFAHLHPSPNSGIPESAVAGALHIELGGTNYYGETKSERARMGWPYHRLDRHHIKAVIRLLLTVRVLMFGGLLCLLCLLPFSF